MAQRRMFSKSITNSSQFLMMPQSSQNLYFHLGMNADDDGFCEHFTIMRMTDSKPDDLKILQAKGFISVFDDKVLVIIDWKENNYLRADRYTPSKYLEVYKEEIKRLSSGIPKVATGKDRLGKDRIGKDREEDTAETSSARSSKKTFNPLGAEIIKSMIEIDPKNKNFYNNTTQRKACDFLLEEYGLDKVLSRIKLLSQLNRMPYFPSIHTPYDLQEKWKKLEEAVEREQLKANSKKRDVIF